MYINQSHGKAAKVQSVLVKGIFNLMTLPCTSFQNDKGQLHKCTKQVTDKVQNQNKSHIVYKTKTSHI